MLIELYVNTPELKFKWYKTIDFACPPTPKDVYHDIDVKRSFVFLSFHFTDTKVMAILMPINTNYFDAEFGLDL